MLCMRTAVILLLWQCLVATDKLCGRSTVLTEYRGVHCVAEIWNKIKETCSIHEKRNTKPITDNTVH